MNKNQTWRRVLTLLCVMAMLVGIMVVGSVVAFAADDPAPVASGNVAKVGDTEYATIDEAIANWTNNTTLTLLADVTLSDVIQLSSTEMHTLNLGTFTMTAASKKDAIQIVNNGRSSASYALDIKADADNPGGITATGKAVVRTTGKSGVKDRPIIRFYNGVFNASYIVYHSGSNGTNCPQFQFHGGVFNGTIFANRALMQFYGGTFTGSIQISVDSSAYGLVAGGTFKNLSNLYGSSLNSDKFTIGSAKGVYDKEVYVDDNGNFVIASAEPSEGIEASVAKTPGTNDYLAYSKVATEGQLNYTDAVVALKNNNTTSAKVTIYADEIDLDGVNFKGTIVVPEGETLKIFNAPEGLKTEGNVEIVVPVASVNGVEYTSLEDAFAAAQAGETIVLLADATPALTSQRAITAAAVIDLNGKTLTLTKGDLYFGTTTFQNGNIVVASNVYASTAVFWMFENQSLTFDDVELVATGVTGTYLIGINGGTGTEVNILNSTLTIDNASTAALTAVICDNGNGNSVVINNSTLNVKNIEGRVYLGGTNGDVTVTDSTLSLNGVKEGFYLRAGQTLAIEGNSNVTIVLNSTDGRHGINVTDMTATYTKADTATVDATVFEIVPAAMIGSVKYATLQAAINAVQNGETIVLTKDLTENVTLTEKVGLSYTIDGNGKNFDGTMTVESLSDTNDNRRITIQNVNFVNTADEGCDFIYSVKDNHYPRLSVLGCTFTGNGKDTDVAIRTKSAYDLIIKNCEGEGLHSFLQNTAGVKVTVQNVTVTESKGGLALGTAQNVTVRGCEINTRTYGIRLDAVLNTSVTLNGNTVESYIPVSIRKASATEYKLSFNGSASNYTATNSDGVWCAIVNTEYEEGVALNAPTGNVKITWNTDVLDESAVYGAYEWPVHVVFSDGYTKGFDSLKSAMNFGYSGGTLEKIIVHRDITESMDSLEGNIVTDNPNGVTIKNTIVDEWIYCSDNFTIGEGVTYDASGYLSGLFVYADDCVIKGTVIVDCYYQRYADSKLTIYEPGSMTVKTETFILRYTEGTDTGIYIIGDNNTETVGLNASVIYFYQGVISAKDANIVVGTYWQTNETDGSGYAKLLLDNSTLNVTVTDHAMKATGNSTVVLTNGSNVSAAGGYTGVAVSADATSEFTVKGKTMFVAKVGDNKYTTLADAVAAVEEGGTVTLLSDVIFTEATRAHNSGTWYDGLYYVGDKSFTIDLGGFTITHDGSVNDYLLNFKNVGSKANVITIKNGTVDAGTTAFCAICTSSTQENQLTINLEDVNVINNISNGSTIKVRGGAVLNVKYGTVITGKNSYLGIECVASTVNIYDGAEIYMNGTSSYNGCLVGVCSNGTVNVYGGYGKGAKGGFIAMTSGGTINVYGGEWIANTDGTVGNNSNVYVLTAQNNKYESGYAGASIINVYGGTFRGGMDAWILNDVTVEKAELNIQGGNFNANPTHYLVDGYMASANNGVYTVVKAVAQIGTTYYATLVEAFKAATEGCTIEILADVTIEGKWDCRDYATGGSHSQFKESVTINGNGHTIKFVGTVSDGNWNTIFRFEENATVTNLTVDISEATGAQRVISAKKSLTVDGLTVIGSAKYGIIFGEGSSAADLAAAEIVIKNSTLTGTRRAISDNEGGKDVKSVVITGNTLNANVYVSASESITFNNNTANGEVDLRSYAAENVLTVEAKGNTLTAGVKNYIYAKSFDAQVEFAAQRPAFKVSTKAELNAALAAAQDGDTIVLTADIDYGTDQLALTKAITLDLGGKTLTTRNAYGGMSVKGNATVKNGTIVHASNTAAIKVWNATAFEDLVIDVQGKGDANKTIGGIVLQSGSTTRVGSIKNVTIKGAALTNGIETYNCGDATENVIGSLENVTIDAVGTGMLISAPVGTATNCTIKGGVNAVELWIKGNYNATLTLEDCALEGGVYAHDEFSTNPDVVNNGKLGLTVDAETTGADVTLTLNRPAENAEGVIADIVANSEAQVNGTYYATLADAIAAAQADDVVTILAGNYTCDISVKNGVTLVGETDANGNNLVNITGRVSATTGATVKNLNIHNEKTGDYDCALNVNGANIVIDGVKLTGYNGMRYCYANGDITIKNSTINASNFAVHFDGKAGGNVQFVNCDITGWCSYAGTISAVSYTDCELDQGNYAGHRYYNKNISFTNCDFADGFKIELTSNNTNVAFTDSDMTMSDVKALFKDPYRVLNGNVTLNGEKATYVASANGKYYDDLQECINDLPESTSTYWVYLRSDVVLENTLTIPAGKKLAINLNGKTISGTHGSEYSMIHVLNGAELTIEGNGTISYAAGGNNTGAAIWVEGKLTLDGGIIELTGAWTLGFAVDVRPNAWGTAHTTGASFVMNGGTVKSTDTAVRVASNSSDAYDELGVTFTMNGGSIVSDWDAIFVQHLYNGDLDINVLGGTVSGANSAMRIYGNAGSDIDMIVSGGNFTGVIKVADAYVGTDAIAISGGIFNAPVAEAYCADGYIPTKNSDGTYGVKEGAFVVRNTTTGVGYESLVDALEAAQAGDEIALLADVEATEVILIDKSLTINGNGHKVTSSATRVFRVTVGNVEVTLNDVNMVNTAVRVGSNDIRGISIDDVTGVELTLNNCSVDFTDASATDWSYAVNVVGGSGHTVNVNGGTYEGANVINVRGASQTVVVKDATLTSLYPDNDVYYGACIYVVQNANSSVVAEGNTFNGTNAIAFNVGYTPVTESNNTDNTALIVAKVGNTYYTSLADAFAAAQDGETITLLHNITLDVSITNTKNVTLDLNGKTITGTDNATGSFGLITNKGTLTITGNGTITLVATNNRGWSAYSSVISNQVGGKLVVENGTLEHLGGTAMAYAIDNLTNGKGTYAEVVINGGTVKSTYRAIRQFLNGTEAQNILTVNGGTIEGANKAIWMQDPSKNANTGKLTVGANAVINGNIYLDVTEGSTSWPVEVAIANAAFADGSTVIAENVPAQYAVQNVGGIWGVVTAVASVNGVSYGSVADAIAAAQTGDVVTLLANVTEDVTIDKNITLDGAGFNFTGTISITKVNVTIQNVNFITGAIEQSGDANNSVLTVKSCSFVDGTTYAITTRYVKSVIIEDCTVKRQSLLYAPKTTTNINISRVTVENGNYVVNVSYGTNVTLVEVTAIDVVRAIQTQNYSAKNIVIRDCNLDVDVLTYVSVKKDNVTENVTFEGDNVINAFANRDYATYKLAAGATITSANADVVIGTDVDGYVVFYTDGVYALGIPYAKIGDVYYPSLQAAINAAQNGETVTVLKDIDFTTATEMAAGSYASYVVVAAGKSITLDMNGHTFNVTHMSTTDRVYAVIAVENGADLIVTGNGTIDVTVDATTPKIAYLFLKHGTTGHLTIENGYYHMNNSEDSLVYSSGDETVTVNGGTFVLDLTGTRPNGFPPIFNASGNNIRNIIVNGGRYNVDINHQYWAFEAQLADGYATTYVDGYWTVAKAVAYVLESSDDKPREVGYATLEEAFAAAIAYGNTTVTLISDIVLTDGVTVPAGATVTLDLNGKTISGTDNATSSFGLINLAPGADLVINDTVGGGKITLVATNNRGWNAYSSVISVQRAKLTVNAGTIQHLGGTDMAYAIDVLTNTGAGDAEAVINGGYIVSTYRAIRQFLNSTVADNILTVNGGVIEGANKAIWVQNANKNANPGTLTVEAGAINGDILVSGSGAEVVKITVKVAASTVADGKAVISSNLPNGYIVDNVDGYYQIARGLNGSGTETDPYIIYTVEDLIFFRDSVNAGETKYNASGVYVVLGADIDLAAENWVAIGSAYADHGFMGNFDGNGFKIKNLTITNPALDSDGYAYAGFFGVTEGIDKDNQNFIKNLVIENVTIETSGHIVAAAIAYPYYTALENITVCGNIAIKGGNYTAGALAYTRRCVDAKNVTVAGNAGSYITGNQTVGGVISDIQMNGGLVANYSNFSVSGVTITGTKNVGGISGIIAGQTLDGATVKNVTLVSSDARVGIVAGSLGATSTISNVVTENVTGATAILGGCYDNGAAVQAKIGDTYYATLQAACDVAGENDTITLLFNGVRGSALLLDSSIGIYFIVDDKAIVEGVTYTAIIRDKSGNEVGRFAFDTWIDNKFENAYAVLFEGIYARQMSDVFSCEIVAEGKNIEFNNVETSVKSYVERGWTSFDDKTKDLLTALLNYGAASEGYWGYTGNEGTANDVEIDDFDTTVNTTPTADELGNPDKPQSTNGYYATSSANIQNNVQFNFKFNVAGIATISHAEFTYVDKDGIVQTVTVEYDEFHYEANTHRLVVTLDSIDISYYKTAITCKLIGVEGETIDEVTDSIFDYCTRAINGNASLGESGKVALKLYCALVEYAKAVENYKTPATNN